MKKLIYNVLYILLHLAPLLCNGVRKLLGIQSRKDRSNYEKEDKSNDD